MLDFCAVHYLGLRHASRALPPWEQLTTGVPAALREAPEALRLATRLAQLQGCQQAALGPSTLHLFWDLMPMLARKPCVIYLDRSSYPIAGWGVERAAHQGVPVLAFERQDPRSLAQLLTRHPPGARAVVVCDGLSTCCGKPAPLPAYLALLPRNGWLVVDDTQALGLLGATPNRQSPWGSGGGGSTRYHSLRDERLILVCSLAKAFGAPLAALSGSEHLLAHFKNYSQTRLHCSPPALPEILAAQRALRINAQRGDHLRARLLQLVRDFRRRLQRFDIPTGSTYFPVQNLCLPEELSLPQIVQHLQQAGIQPLVRQCGHKSPRFCLSFVINASQTRAEIQQAAQAVGRIVLGGIGNPHKRLR